MSTPEYQALDKEWSPKLSAAYRRDQLNPKLFQRIKALYDARDSRRARRQAEAAADPHLRQLRPQRRQARRRAEGAAVGDTTSSLPTLFSDFNEQAAGRRGHLHHRDRGRAGGRSRRREGRAAAAAKERKLPAGTYAIMQHALGGRAGADLRRQPRASREGVARVRQPRRQWRRQRHQRDHRQDREAARRPRQAARLQEPRRLADAGHDGQDAGQGDGPDDARLARGRRARERRSRRHAGARRQGRASRSRSSRGTIATTRRRSARRSTTSARTRSSPISSSINMVKGMFWAAGRALRPRLQGEHRHGPGLPPGRPHLRGDQSPRPARSSACSTSTPIARDGKRSGAWMTTYRSRAGLLGDNIVLGVEQQQFHQAGAGQAGADQPRRRRDPVPRVRPRHPLSAVDVNYPSLGGHAARLRRISEPGERELAADAARCSTRFARHYQTGQPMPQALVDKIEKAETFNQGFATVEYLSSALVDMKLHIEARRRRRSRRVRERGAGRDRHAEGDGDAAPPAAVRPPLLVATPIRPAITPTSGRKRWTPTPGRRSRKPASPWDKTIADALQDDPAVDRQRDRPRRGLSPVPRPRSGRERRCSSGAASRSSKRRARAARAWPRAPAPERARRAARGCRPSPRHGPRRHCRAPAGP